MTDHYFKQFSAVGYTWHFCVFTQSCTVHQKRVNLFLLCPSNMNRFQWIGIHVLEWTFNKTVHKVPISSKYVLALPREIWIDSLIQKPVTHFRRLEPSTQYYTYMYIYESNTTGSHWLKHCQRCSKLHHLYTICSKCPSPARTKNSLSTNWNDAWRMSQQSESLRLLERAVGDMAPACTSLRSCWRWTFRA